MSEVCHRLRRHPLPELDRVPRDGTATALDVTPTQMRWLDDGHPASGQQELATVRLEQEQSCTDTATGMAWA
jgi:hypothetical protein